MFFPGVSDGTWRHPRASRKSWVWFENTCLHPLLLSFLMLLCYHLHFQHHSHHHAHGPQWHFTPRYASCITQVCLSSKTTARRACGFHCAWVDDWEDEGGFFDFSQKSRKGWPDVVRLTLRRQKPTLRQLMKSFWEWLKSKWSSQSDILSIIVS